MRASLLTGGSSASLLALLVTTFLTTSTFASPLPIPQSSSTTTYSKPTIPDGPAAALSWSSGPKDNPVIHVFALDNSGNILEWTKTDDGPKGPGSAWSAPTNIGVKAALGSRISVYYDAFKEKGDIRVFYLGIDSKFHVNLWNPDAGWRAGDTLPALGSSGGGN